MLALGVAHDFDSLVSDEEAGEKTATTAGTTELSKAWPRYDTVLFVLFVSQMIS